MNIHEKENALFSEWSKDRADFVRDGVADHNVWGKTRPSILFILKEVNDLGGGGWDLREFIRGGGRAQTWNNITRWVEGIHNLPKQLNWDSLEKISEKRRIDALRTIAAVNLKKSPGGHTTIQTELTESAQRDKDFINKQFSLYNADFVICCGTSEVFHSLIEFSAEWKSTSRGIWYHEYEKGRYVIEYSHPEARCASSLLYYGLVDAITEIGFS